MPVCADSPPEAFSITPGVLVHGVAAPVSKPGLPSSCWAAAQGVETTEAPAAEAEDTTAKGTPQREKNNPEREADNDDGKATGSPDDADAD